MNRPLSFVCAVASIVVAGAAPAANYTYTGATSNLWSDSTNFAPTGVPGAGDTLIPATAQTQLVLGGDRTILDLDASGISGALTINPAASAGTQSLAITGTLTKSGLGTLNFRGQSGGALDVTVNAIELSAGNLGFGTNTSVSVINSFSASTANVVGGNLRFISTDGGSVSIGSLTTGGTGSVQIRNATSGTGTLEVNSLNGTGGSVAAGGAASSSGAPLGILSLNSTGTSSYGGTLIDSAGTAGVLQLKKGGSGAQILTAANTFSGGTTVTAGSLLVNNASGSGLGSGEASVDGGTLGGTGAFSGAVTVNAGGTLAPGDGGIESLGVGSMTFSGGTFQYQLNTTTADADLLCGGAGSGLTLTGSSTLSLSDLGSGESLVLGTKLTLISYDGEWNNGIFSGYADDSLFSFAGNTWRINYNDTTAGSNFSGDATGASFVTITVEAIPEPSVCGLLVAGGIAMALISKRRRASTPRARQA